MAAGWLCNSTLVHVSLCDSIGSSEIFLCLNEMSESLSQMAEGDLGSLRCASSKTIQVC